MPKNKTKSELQAELEHALSRVRELEAAVMNGSVNDDRFIKIFSASPIQMVLVDFDTRKILDINDAFVKKLGFTREEILGRTPLELNIFLNPNQSDELSMRAKVQGYLREENIKIRTKSGEIRLGSFSAEFIESNGQKLLLAIMDDITDRVLAEKNMELFFSQSLDGIFFMELDEPVCWDAEADKNALLDYILKNQRITRVNDAMLRQYRATREDFVGRTPYDLFLHDLENGYTVFRQLFDNGHMHFLMNERRLDGTQMWVAGDYICTHDEHGRVTGHFGVQRDVTEQKEMETELQASQERWQFALEGTGDGVWDRDVRSRTVFYSSRWKFMLGYADNEISNSQDEWERLVHPDDLPDVLKKINSHLAGETQQYSSEYRMRCKDGSYKWILDRGKVVSWTGDGAPLRIIGTHKDVTERRMAEDVLRASEERFSRMFRSNPAAQLIVKIDDGKILDVNDSFCRQTGFNYEELVGYTAEELNLWQNPEKQKWMLGELRAKGHVHNIELDFKTKYGEIRTLLISFELTDIWGDKCIISSGVDITERKRAEEEKKEAEFRYRALFDQTHDAIFILDFDGAHLDVNQRAADMLGYSPEELCRLSVKETSAELSQSLNIKERLLAGEHIPMYERLFRKKNGETLPVEINVELVRDTYGNPLHIQSVVRDITERKILESALSQNEERYRIISDAVTDYAFSTEVDENGEYIMDWVAGAFESITGYTFEEFVASGGWVAHLHPDDRLIDEHARNELLANRKTAYDVRIFAKNGDVVYLRVYAHPLWDDNKNKLKAIYGAVQNITERKQTDEALQRSERDFRLVMERAPIGLAILHGDGSIGFANENFEQTFGYEPSDISNIQDWWQKAYPDEAYRTQAMSLWGQAVQTALISGIPIRPIEMNITCKNGTIRIAEISGVPIGENFLVMFNDVTERKKAEAGLRESEARATAMLDAIPDLMFRLNRDGVFLDFKADVAELYEQSESLIGLRNRDIAPAKFADLVDEKTREIMDGKKLVTFEYQLDIPERGTQDYEARMVPSGNDEVVAVVRNITERKKAEDKLRESEKKYHDLINGMNDSIMVIDFDTRILDVNNAASVILGYSREELLAMKVSDVDVKLTSEQIHGLANAMPDDVVQIFETEHTAKDGRKIPVEVSSSLITYQDRMVIMSIARDITERKLNEAFIISQRDLAYALGHASTMSAGFKACLEIVLRATGFDSGGIYLFKENQSLLELTYHQGLAEAFVQATSSYPVDAPSVQLILRGVSTYLEAENPAFQSPMYQSEGLRGLGVIPLLYQKKVIGCMNLAAHTPFEITEYTRNIVETLALEVGNFAMSLTAQQSLRASEEQYRGLMESLASVVSTVDANGVFLFMNDMAADSLGGTASELVGKTLFDVFPQEYAERHLRAIQKVIRDDEALVIENQTYVQGKLRWYRVSIQPIHDEAGSVVYALLNIMDIDAIKSAQQELEYLNEKLEERVKERTSQVQDLYNNAPVGYHSVDNEGKFIAINQTELNWLGYTREELLGKPVTSILFSASAKIYEENFPILKKEGRLNGIEFEVRRKDGTKFPVLFNSFAVYDQAGQFTSSRSTLTDITERKQVETALKKANEKLEHALRIKDEFLANMSHELRTPLNSILGFSEMMLSGDFGELNERQRKYTANIESSGNHLLGLINDLLDLSKIEAGMLEIYPEQTDIDEMCYTSLAFVKQLAARKNIHLGYKKELELPFIFADQRRLKQILVNLLSNAVKFTPEHGSVTLRVFMGAEKKFINFSVNDTGIGISENDIPKLFTPFTQLDSRLARQYEGTGLGLSLVKELTELHNGIIHVQSTVGAGSTFTVSIPCKYENCLETIQEKDGVTAKPELEQSKPLAAKKILLAEDAESNIIILGDFLNFHGYEMIYARNGREAIEKAIETLPDLILMDIQMPVMDGLEATRRLRIDPRFTSVPIVALTALAMTGDRERCLEAGATEYVSKPVNLKQLEELIKKLS